MTLKDISHGPAVAVLITASTVLFVLAIVFLSGKGENLIAGFNTMDERERKKYDQRLLLRIVGVAILAISLFLGVMALFFDTLPHYTAYVFLFFTIAISIIVIVFGNTICRNK